MTFLFLICLLLAVMSYFQLTKDTFHREFSFQVHDFKTPHYIIGISSEDMGCEDQIVTSFTIGFLFFIIRLTTYAHTEGTIKLQPWLKEESLLPTWQKILNKFLDTMKIQHAYTNKDA